MIIIHPMIVLCVTLLAFLVGRMMVPLSSDADTTLLSFDATIPFVGLMIVHYIGGVTAWVSHYNTFPNRVAYAVAFVFLIACYSFNWSAYSPPVLEADSWSIMANGMAMLGIFFPVIMYVGGPLVAIINAPAEDEEEE